MKNTKIDKTSRRFKHETILIIKFKVSNEGLEKWHLIGTRNMEYIN